ncbi:hypothetical protein GCM10010420_23700 [Streptomyces glaucosporus]|uniref:Uncharacterized protein n=1 Tax=Streptomyces glaucosporus TaxID=284044 RepID=A0ABN3I830_9ACTN
MIRPPGGGSRPGAGARCSAARSAVTDGARVDARHAARPRRRPAAHREFTARGFTGAGGSPAAPLTRWYGARAVRSAVRAARDTPVGPVTPDQRPVPVRELERP